MSSDLTLTLISHNNETCTEFNINKQTDKQTNKPGIDSYIFILIRDVDFAFCQTDYQL